VRTKRADTVGEFKSAEMGVLYLPALKAKKRGKLAQEKVLLEPCRRFANSIRALSAIPPVDNYLWLTVHGESGDRGSGVYGGSTMTPVSPIDVEW